MIRPGGLRFTFALSQNPLVSSQMGLTQNVDDLQSATKDTYQLTRRGRKERDMTTTTRRELAHFIRATILRAQVYGDDGYDVAELMERLPEDDRHLALIKRVASTNPAESYEYRANVFAAVFDCMGYQS